MSSQKTSIGNQPVRRLDSETDLTTQTIPIKGKTTFEQRDFNLHGSDVFHPDHPVPVVVTDKCDPIRTKLHDLEVKLKSTDKFDAEPKTGEKNPPKPKISDAWKQLNLQITNTRLSLNAC